MVGDRHGQCRAFFRIGGGAQLVEDHERSRSRRPRDEVDIGDVRGKSRKVLLDRLVVADIGQHGVEDREFRRVRRHGQARLRHQRQQADGLQCNRLASRVRPGYDQLALVVREFDGDRHHAQSPGAQGPLQQRMAGAAQYEPRLGALPRESYLGTVVVFGKARFGELQFDFGQHVGCKRDGVGLRGDALGHLQQDAVDFGLLFFQQPHQLVVLLDGLQRLDEYRLAAGADPVHHAVDALLLLDLDGNHEPLAADGDQFVLHRARVGQPAQVTL